MTSPLISRYLAIEERAKQAAARFCYAPPKLLAVSKFQAVSAMQELAEYLLQCNRQVCFGESYVQEYRAKRPQLPAHSVHMIGRLQRNKAREAVELFDVIESVHSLALAETLQREAEKCQKKQIIYLQVNISNDEDKAGFRLNEFLQAWREISTFSNLQITGLMTITKIYPIVTDVRQDFVKLRELVGQVSKKSLVLSMGMSADYEIAAEEGAGEVRVGSALFGTR